MKSGTFHFGRSLLSGAAREWAWPDRKIGFNWLTLSFPEGLETEFRRDYARKSLWHVRLGLALGIVLWLWSGWIDLWVLPDMAPTAWFIRYAVVLPPLLLVFLFTYSRHFDRFMQPAAAAACLIVALGIIAIEKVLVQPTGVHSYDSGLLVMVPAIYMLVRLRFINAACTSLSMAIIENIASILFANFPPQVLVAQNFYLMCANVVAMLAGYNIEVYLRRDFLQRRAAEEQRRIAEDKTRQLENANLAKSRFLAAASHDLRQPLHALGLFVAQLRATAQTPDQGRLVERIDTAVASMNHLFNALLDIAKLDAGVLVPNRTEFAVAHLLDVVETTFADAAREKGLRLRIVKSHAWVRSDAILLERIVLNLVSNAVRYTTRGGVLVGCRRRGGVLRIEVWDTGPGIPEDQRQNIFGEFVQLAGQTARPEGLGLGLAIVEGLCRLLDHTIELTSALGKGSRFAVELPLAAARAKAAAPAPRVVTHALHGKLVIVIDDDALVLDGMRGLLTGWGCDVVTASSEDAALASLDGRMPDVIVSDYRLGDGITGIDLIGRLREMLGLKVPAFVISGDTAPERLREARASGYHLLHKPVQPMALRAMLSQVLKRGARARGGTRAATLQP